MLGHAMNTNARLALATATAALLLTASAGVARAMSWCAQPLVVHEWGVHVFDRGGAAAAGVPIPGHFHGPGDLARSRTPVREFEADSGERALPVLHFYTASPFNRGVIPVGVEVGFTAGSASSWFPAVDRLQPAAVANGPGAAAARAQLLAQRAARASDPRTWQGVAPPLPADPTRQLVWDRLDLTMDGARSELTATDAAWVQAARQIDGALWVNGGRESDRFLFYEGRTVERVPLKLRRAGGWRADHRAYVLENDGAHPVHDVFVVHDEPGATYVFTAPTIPAGGGVELVLEDHAVKDRDAATLGALRPRLVDPAHPRAPTEAVYEPDACVMDRDPAIPTEKAADHRLFDAEADLLLATWKGRLFPRGGTSIVYREDIAYLDQVTPLSIYTDMYHYPVVHRAGLALWRDVALP